MQLRRKHLAGASVFLLALCGIILWLFHSAGDQAAFAISGGTFPAQQYLIVSGSGSDGGMAPYGQQILQSSSSSATLQAIADWNTYIVARSEWGMGLTATLQDRLATADWNARQGGSATITPQQLATAATNLVNAKLATMTREQQEALFEANLSEMTPKGLFALNQDNNYVSAILSGGKWVVSVSPDAFTAHKNFFKSNAAGMVSSGTNFYPGEAALVFYSIAADDIGFGGQYSANCRKGIGDLTGLDMSTRYLYGDNGYLFRRPLSTFLTEQAVSQFFSQLGF